MAHVAEAPAASPDAGERGVGHGSPAAPTCCVIGAGAAGLAAAEALSRAGWAVTVREARDRIGGRCAHALLAGADVDLGAEFSHGRGAVLDLCAKAGIEARALYSYDESAPPEMRTRVWADGELSDGNGTDHAATRACRALYEEIMGDERWDSTRPEGGDDVSFATLTRERGLSASTIGVFDAMHAVEYATSLDDLGVLEWRRREEVLHDCETDYSLQGRFTHSLSWLKWGAMAAGAQIILSAPVMRAQALADHVLVDGQRFDASIVTVPLGVLQQGGIELVGLSATFRAAVSAVRFHSASKVVVAIAPGEWARCVTSPIPPMVLSGSADAFAKQIWTRRTASGVVLLTGFLAGPRDSAVAEVLSCDEAAERLVAQFSQLLGLKSSPAYLDALKKVSWGATDPWAAGAYSSPTVGACGAWRALQDTGSEVLLYAGEAVSERGSTVDSALDSGRRAAAELCASLKAARA